MFGLKKKLEGLKDKEGHTLSDDEHELITEYRALQDEMSKSLHKMKDILHGSLNK